MVNNCINFIQNLLFQPSCLLCGNVTHTTRSICQACADNLPANDFHCRICSASFGIDNTNMSSGPVCPTSLTCPTCQKRPPSYSSSFVPYLYKDRMCDLVQQFKFHHNLTAGKALCQLFVDKLTSCKELPDVLIPVPLHPYRMRQRGFNQSGWLATEIAKSTGISVDHSAIRRRQNTEAQHRISRQKRMQNLRKAFSSTRPVDEKHIAIIDDVMTTGATAEAISKVIKQSSDTRIDIWAIARTPDKQSKP